MKRNFVLVLMLFVSMLTRAQEEVNICKIKVNNISALIIDSIQFSVYTCSNINTGNNDCLYIMAEGYENEVPAEGIKVLCVLFIESIEDLKDFDYLRLFDKKGDCANRNKVKLIYIYDVDTGFNKAFYGEKELKKAYKLDLRSGIPKEE